MGTAITVSLVRMNVVGRVVRLEKRFIYAFSALHECGGLRNTSWITMSLSGDANCNVRRTKDCEGIICIDQNACIGVGGLRSLLQSSLPRGSFVPRDGGAGFGALWKIVVVVSAAAATAAATGERQHGLPARQKANPSARGPIEYSSRRYFRYRINTTCKLQTKSLMILSVLTGKYAL